MKNCPNLKYLNIPDNVGVIDDSNCENTYIQKVIPNNKHYVWLDDVLWNINQRKIIYLPRRKKNTETLFPYECKDMKIALCKNDTIYNSSKWIDNILFDKDTTKIMGYHSPMDSILDLNKYKKLNSIVEHAFNGNQDIKKLILSNSCEYGEYAFANCAIDTIITANQSCLTPLFTYNNKNRITYIIDNIDGYIKDKGIIRNDKGNAVLLSSEYKGDFYTEKSMNGDTLYLFVHGYNAAIVGGKIYHSGTLNDENIIKRCEFVGFRYIYSDMSNKNVIISPYPYLDCSYLSSNAQEIRIISESAHSKTNIINLPDSLRRNIRLYVPPGHLQKYLSDYGFKSVIEYDYFRYACELINNKIHLSGDYFSRHPVEFCLIILGLMIIGFIFYILCLNETAYILSKKARFFAAFGKMLRMVFLGLMWYIASYWIVFYTIMDSKLLSNCIAIPSTLLVLALFYYNVLYAIKDIGWKKLFDRLFLTIRREIQRYRRICRILLLSFIISFSLFEYFNYLDTYQQQILSVAQECYNKGKYNDALKVVISGLSSHFIQGDSIAMNILKYDNSVELGGHTRRVNSACFSFDGKYIVTASDDKTAILWNASTYEIVDTLLGHTRGVNSACFSFDGKYIVTASDDKTAILWNASTYEIVDTLLGHTRGVNSACFSFDGKYIATASDDRTTKVWNVESREVIATLQHRESVNTAFFSSDSKYIVTASDGVSLQKDNVMVRIWETSTGKLLKVFKGHILDVNSAFFSPNDKYVITASSDHTAKIWDAETGELIKTLDKHRGDVNSAFLSFDGKLIVTASDDEKVMIWDASTFEIIETLKGYDLWGGIASFSSDGKLVIAASDKSAIMWIIDPSLLYEHCKKLVEKNPLSEEEREKYGIKWWMKW